jgi:hypothetical protein
MPHPPTQPSLHTSRVSCAIDGVSYPDYASAAVTKPRTGACPNTYDEKALVCGLGKAPDLNPLNFSLKRHWSCASFDLDACAPNMDAVMGVRMIAGMSSEAVSNASQGLADGLQPWHGWAAAIALLVFLGVILKVVLARRRPKIEDPSRLTDFFKELSCMKWNDEDAVASLDRLASATTTLFQAEVTYYYRTRTARRFTASLFRWSAFLFGTAGLACPLLETAVPSWAGVSRLGYVLLAVAAASLAGNELFGGTKGHIRSVMAQYTLERMLHAFVVDWSEWRSTVERTGQWSGGFAILRRLSDGVYLTLLDETKEWGAAVSEAEAGYRASVSNSTGSADPAKR